jgi:hypothetical protein
MKVTPLNIYTETSVPREDKINFADLEEWNLRQVEH